MVQTLYGLGGVGKTQLALEYAHRFAADYDLIWWIDAEQPVLIPEQLVPGQATFALLMVSARRMTLRSRGSVACRFRQAM